MSNDWFRSWHGAPTDNKWLLIAKRANVKPIHVSGTWWALLDHASQHSDRGFVGDFDQETFALFAGLDEEHVSRIVTELCDKGMIVDGFIVQWGKRQPKREDGTAAERKRRSREGSRENGGNPPKGGKKGTPDQSRDEHGHAVSHNVTLDTDEIREDSSVAKATGTVVPHPAASDFCKMVFDSGRSLLVAHGRDARQAGSLIGRMRKTVGDAEMLTLIREAETKSEPAEWLIAAVETRNGNRAQRQSDLSPDWRLRDGSIDPLAAALREAHADCAEGAASYPQDDPGAWLSLPAVTGR